MKPELNDTMTQFLAILICIVLNLSVLLALTASALQTDLSRFLQLA